MLYLDYAKQTEDGYIMNFFANSVEDLEDISEGKEFVTKNGTNYGVPAPQSVVTITNKDGEKTTYLMGEDGNWIPGVVNPTDYYTKKQVDAKLEGKEGKITDINLTETGTTITYDATDGITLNSTARLTSNGTETHDSTMKLELPLIGGTGILIDKAENAEAIKVGIDPDSQIKVGSVVMYSNYAGATGTVINAGSVSISGTPGVIQYKDIRDNSTTYLMPSDDVKTGSINLILPDKSGTLATTDDINGITDLSLTDLSLTANTSTINFYDRGAMSQEFIRVNRGSVASPGYSYQLKTPVIDGDRTLTLPSGGSWMIARAGTIGDGRIVLGNGGDTVRGSNLRETDLMTTGNVKTLFGNQSIVGTGNIDLYKHNVSLFIPDNISLSCNVYSSSSTKINTKELLITLAGLSNPPKFGDSPTIAAYGWYKKENDVYAIITQISNDYTMGLQIQTFSGFDKSGMSMIEFPNETITDTVTTI